MALETILVPQCDPDENMSTFIGLIAMKCRIDIQSPKKYTFEPHWHSVQQQTTRWLAKQMCTDIHGSQIIYSEDLSYSSVIKVKISGFKWNVSI